MTSTAKAMRPMHMHASKVAATLTRTFRPPPHPAVAHGAARPPAWIQRPPAATGVVPPWIAGWLAGWLADWHCVPVRSKWVGSCQEIVCRCGGGWMALTSLILPRLDRAGML